MSKSKKLSAISILACLALSGCGEGWELVKYEGNPYSNSRTAGSGVAYVLARMAPAKEEIAIKPRMADISEKADNLLQEEKAAPIPEPAPVVEEVKSAEPIFDNAQKK